MEIPNCYRALGIAVAARRKKNKVSQEVLARAVGLSRASIANIETGRQKVLLHHVYLIAEALSCESITELIPEKIQRREQMPQVKTMGGAASALTEKEIAQAHSIFLHAKTPKKGR